jgi:hypothetical protein
MAEPLFLARYIEKSGTGTLDMINLCAQAGLATPAFRQDGGQFVLIRWRPQAGAAGGDSPPAAPSGGTKQGPSQNPRQSQQRRGFDRTDASGQAQRPHQVQAPSHSAPDQDGWLEMTQPQSPRSPQQKYRLTAQGQALLDEQAKGKK